MKARKKQKKLSPPTVKHPEIGQAIRVLRGDRTQVEVAARADLHPTSWSLYEQGRQNPSAASRLKICQGLGVSTIDFERMIWRFRRQRLAETRADGGPWAMPEETDPVRRDLRQVLGPLLGPLEDFLLWLRRPE